MKRSLWLVLFGLVVALPAVAQVGGDGVKAQNMTGLRIAGVQTADSTVRIFRMDSNGYLYTLDASKDRDFGQYISTGIPAGTAIAAGKSVQTPNGIDVSKFNKLTLILNWTLPAAADSDSVNIAVKVYGKYSSSMGDGVNAPLNIKLTANSVADTARIHLPTGVSAASFAFIPPSFYITRNITTGLNIIGTAYNSGSSIVTACGPRLVWAGNGCAIVELSNLSDYASFPYIGFDLSNWNVTKNISSLSATLWGSR